MKIIGLTGSIGMGKSTVAAMLAEMVVPVFDADAAVHELYAPGGAAVPLIEAVFPGVVREGAVDRTLLSAQLQTDPTRFADLNAIVHPLVGRLRTDFLKRAKENGAAMVVLDVPLLFEGGGEKSMDAVIVVSAPEEIQRARVLARPGMNETKYAEILSRQMPDEDKRKRADYIIDTGGDLDVTRAQVKAALDSLREAV
jgi:dephospho-CoA kinase